MPKQSNQPDRLSEIRRSLQAREILVALDTHGTSNDKLFYRWLAELGLSLSQSDLASLLDRLDNDGLTSSEKVENFRIIKLTFSGREVIRGLLPSDWIAEQDLPE
jgi:DNA-binding MarR family transcriptional regulator